MRGLVLEAPEVAERHTAPGQYVQVVAGAGAAGYFALANAPGAPPELLVKRGAPAADALAALASGTRLEVSEPVGGYPVAQHAGRDLLLVAAGSGIAPIRGVVRHVMTDRARWGAVTVYHGQRVPGEFAYAGEHAEWRSARIDVVKVLSGAADAWGEARGHVQDALRGRPPALANAVVYVCGMKPMVAGVRDALRELGLAGELVFLNY